MTSQNSQLVGLPRELLDNITSSLPTLDFNALRLTCKELEAKLFPYWANCFFKKRQFMIDEFSLQTLVDISRHAALSKVMTHLVIGLDELQASYHLPFVDSAADYSRWRAAYCAQTALLHGGGAVDLLSKALVNLPNLKTIDLRDFNSNTRYRDAIFRQDTPPWRSYGSSRYQQWPRHTPFLFRLNSPTDFIDTVFLVVLTAVGRCSTKVQNLEVILRNRQICLHDDAFSIFGVPEAGLANALHGLTKLHLDLDPGRTQPSGLPHHLRVTIPQHGWFDPCTAFLRRFLGLTPNLTWLRLNFSDRHSFNASSSPSPASKVVSWLALRPDFNPPSDVPWGDGNPAPVALPLRRLDLGNLRVTSVILHGLLKKFGDLEYISMRNVWFQGPAATSSSHQGDTDDNDDCLWARFIRHLHGTNPKLKQLELNSIWEERSNSTYDQIVFRNEVKPTESATFTKFRIIDSTTLDRLAEHTWTQSRWRKSQRGEESMDEDSQDDGSQDEDPQDEDSLDETSEDEDDEEIE